jgi:hypothetical protein
MPKPGDTVETYRGATLCMSGLAGELAKWTVGESDGGNPTFQLARWKPFLAPTVRPNSAESHLREERVPEPELADSGP